MDTSSVSNVNNRNAENTNNYIPHKQGPGATLSHAQGGSPPRTDDDEMFTTSNDEGEESPHTQDMKSSMYTFRQYEKYLKDYEAFTRSSFQETCMDDISEKPVLVLKKPVSSEQRQQINNAITNSILKIQLLMQKGQNESPPPNTNEAISELA